MSQPNSTVAFVSNLFAKLIRLDNVGDIEHTHRHCFDHVTLLARGSVVAGIGRVGDTTIYEYETFTAPHFIYIPKDTPHRFEALEDNTVLVCLHSLKTEDGEDILPPDSIIGNTNLELVAHPMLMSDPRMSTEYIK